MQFSRNSNKKNQGITYIHIHTEQITVKADNPHLSNGLCHIIVKKKKKIRVMSNAHNANITWRFRLLIKPRVCARAAVFDLVVSLIGCDLLGF